jgi:hypothetical protein
MILPDEHIHDKDACRIDEYITYPAGAGGYKELVYFVRCGKRDGGDDRKKVLPGDGKAG